MVPKKQKYKNTKGGKKRNPYKKAAWKSTRPGKNREPEVVALQNDTRNATASEITKDHRVGYNIHIMKKLPTKWWRILEPNVGAKNLCFCKGQNSQKPIHSIKVSKIPPVYAYKKPGGTPFPQIRTRMFI